MYAIRSYYDAFSEYQNGDLASDNFLPSLCSDGTHGVLLSAPFDTLSDAQAFLGSMQQSITRMVSEDNISIIYLGNNELPEYDYENQLEQIINSPIGMNGNEYIIGEPLITEGRFLAWNSSGDQFIYARAYTMLGSQQGDAFSYEEMWIQTNGGDLQLTDQQYTSVLSAAYSHDDRSYNFV